MLSSAKCAVPLSIINFCAYLPFDNCGVGGRPATRKSNVLPPGFIKEGNGSEQLFGEKAAVFQRTVSRTCFNLGQKIPDEVKGTKDTPEVVNFKFQRKQLFCIESVIKLAKVREGRSIPLVNAAMIEQWERYQ